MLGRLIAVAGILVSGFWLHQGIFNYGFWTKGSPGGGFLPAVFGGLVLVLSLVALFRRGTAEKEKTKIEPAAMIPVAAAVGGVVLLQVLGITATVFLFTVGWMKFLSKYSWLKSLAVGVVFTGFIFGVFRLWLSVPFPKGLLGIG